MGFLDEITDPIQGQEVDFSKIYTIEILIMGAMLHSHEKNRYTNRITAIKTNEEADRMIEELRAFQPIMGLERFPTNVSDAAEATRLRIEREDFKERDK